MYLYKKRLSESLMEDTRNFTTKNLLEAKAWYESMTQERGEVERYRHLATIEVLVERGELDPTTRQDIYSIVYENGEPAYHLKDICDCEACSFQVSSLEF